MTKLDLHIYSAFLFLVETHKKIIEPIRNEFNLQHFQTNIFALSDIGSIAYVEQRKQ